MSKLYLPTAEQFDRTLANLAQIANALSTKIDVSSGDWESIARAVRSGIAPSLYPIGSELTVLHSKYGEMAYEVVAHDYFKNPRNESAPTMTLMSVNLMPPLQYDSAEAFYYANSSLPAGTYNFTISNVYSSWSAGTYQFTLTKPVPAMGQLAISNNAATVLTSLKVRSYASRIATDYMEEVAITIGNSGTSLGTLGNELNHVHRVSYGSNNYKESAIRQFLNSEGAVGSVWNPQTKYDRPPSWVGTADGFMRGFDADFLSIVGKVRVPCSTNSTYEAPDSATTKGAKYTLNDRFYLPSQKEIFGDLAGTVDDGSTQFTRYEKADSVDFIKYRDNVASMWRTRTPNPWPAHDTRVVGTDGVSTPNGAASSLTFAVLCTIV